MNYRNLFVGVDRYIQLKNGKKVIPINFDNGATTPPLKCAVKAIEDQLDYYGSIGRGTGFKSTYCTKQFQEARNDILRFFHLEPEKEHTVIYVKSTTEGLNLLAYTLGGRHTIVLSTRMEHHANDLPWRYYARHVDYVDVESDGRLSIDQIERKLREYRGNIKYVAVTAASNVTGYVNDINKIASICHKYGAKIIVDAAQLVAHREINMAGTCKEEQIDFLVFSAHKAYAPFGGGAVIGLCESLGHVEPFLKGGAAVSQVFEFSQEWLTIPDRLEAGTQNYFGVISMASALNKLKEIGFLNIEQHENELKNYLNERMKKIPHITLYGDCENTADRLGILIFTVKDHDYEKISDELGIKIGAATRCGKFCAHPYVTRLLNVRNYPDNSKEQDDCGMIRLSLGLYNTKQEADRFLWYLENMDQQV